MTETSNVGGKGKVVNFATDEDLISCRGDFCNHCSFKPSDKGSNVITELCPVCNAALTASLGGKCLKMILFNG
jgi:hypothetical protein